MALSSILDIFASSHHGFWWEVLSLASAGVALALLAIALLAYRRHRLKRLLPLSAAFGLFVLKVGLLHLDSLYPALEEQLQLASIAAEFGMLSMILFAIVRK